MVCVEVRNSRGRVMLVEFTAAAGTCDISDAGSSGLRRVTGLITAPCHRTARIWPPDLVEIDDFDADRSYEESDSHREPIGRRETRTIPFADLKHVGRSDQSRSNAHGNGGFVTCSKGRRRGRPVEKA